MVTGKISDQNNLYLFTSNYIHCNVLQVSPVKEGPSWRRRDVTVKDPNTTSTIRLKLWNADADATELEVDETYTAKNLVTATYKGMVSLNSTMETVVSKVCYSFMAIILGNRHHFVIMKHNFADEMVYCGI
jgi:hypothetical protein